MKKLTTLLIIAGISLLSFQVNAQGMGIKAGLTMATMEYENDQATYSDTYKMTPGFHVGLTYEVPLIGILSFEPGLIFTTKGAKYEDTLLGIDFDAVYTLYYIDIPLYVKAAVSAGDNLKLYAAAGPYVGLGISGVVKTTTEVLGIVNTEEDDIEWGNDEAEDDLKNVDMGLTFGAGLEISSLLLGVSYDLGMANISSYQDFGTTRKNNVLKLSIGYKF
ncbi:MAG: PorT family protein [Bacteroidales bacterium]|jgi:hypothetical protein|nr:PorT family protein [Bacteroidales bacterium]MDD2323085.1 porin family protein [Bacteroidales bacterium]MDY0284896.1 porin family protein [Bacteroidales bacterium]NCC74307.1 PorT family protein [Sphingobacteriia bacterium]